MGGRSALRYVDAETAFLYSGVWSAFDDDFLEKVVFKLCYSMSNGSGLNFGYSECMDMPLTQAIRFSELLDETRSYEAKLMNSKG